MLHPKSTETTNEGHGYCLAKIPSHTTDAALDVDTISQDLVEATIHAMPVSPDGISHLRGPLLEVTKVDTHTADIKIIHGFRAHFGTPSKKGRFTNCLIQAPGEALKMRVNHRGSLSFSDLSELEAATVAVEGGRGEWEIDTQEIRLGRRIAVGGFAEVFVAEYQGTIVAVKRLFDRDAVAISNFKREVTLLAKLRHPNLILFMGYCLSPELCIVSEFMHKGCLFNHLREHDGTPLASPYIENVLISVARAMAYLHSRSPPVLHLDLKSPNILIDRDWRVKVTDFGLSKLRNRTLVSNNGGMNGTPHWMSPESVRGEKIDEKSDVYSYGVVMWEVLTGLAPWERLNAIQVIAAVGFKNKQLPKPDHPDAVLVDLMSACCAPDPIDRPSFPEILDLLDDRNRSKHSVQKIRTMQRSTSGSTEPTSPAIGTIVEVFSGTDQMTTASTFENPQPCQLSSSSIPPLTDKSTPETTADDQSRGEAPLDIRRSVDRLETFERVLRLNKSAPNSRSMTSPFAAYAAVPVETSDDVDRPCPTEPTPSGETPRSTFEFSPFSAFTDVPFTESGDGNPDDGAISTETSNKRESDALDGFPSLSPMTELESGGNVGRSDEKTDADAWRIKVADLEAPVEDEHCCFEEDVASHELLDDASCDAETASIDETSIDFHPRSDMKNPSGKRRCIPPMTFVQSHRL